MKNCDEAKPENDRPRDPTRLGELRRSRAEFLGMLSHELRAPLSSIKGSAATVLGASRAPDRTEMLLFFEIIDQQADYMRGLISDLLDVGSMEAGMLSLTAVPADLANLVDQAVNAFQRGGGRHFVLKDVPAGLVPVMADRQRLVQVLSNLLSHAAANSPRSCPMSVAAARDGAHVAISVAYEGGDAPGEELPSILRQHTGFGGDDAEQEPRGSRLGLAICKGLVEAHGGRLWGTRGEVGQGTRLTFTIPAAESALRAAGVVPRHSFPVREPLELTPILVVDDDPETLRYVADALAAAGYTPIVTADHREISRIIETDKPRLVVLDLLLPETDAFELMDNVPELADLPVVFISGYGKDETIERALEKGAADYIVKPFSPTELTARIGAALRRREAPEPFVLGDLTIDYEERRVNVAGRPVRLTPTEYELLRVLSFNAGRVSTYDALIRQVWGGQDSGDPKLVRTFVKKLRHKLGDSATRPAYIFNERGVGYRMSRPRAS